MNFLSTFAVYAFAIACLISLFAASCQAEPDEFDIDDSHDISAIAKRIVLAKIKGKFKG